MVYSPWINLNGAGVIVPWEIADPGQAPAIDHAKVLAQHHDAVDVELQPARHRLVVQRLRPQQLARLVHGVVHHHLEQRGKAADEDIADSCYPHLGLLPPSHQVPLGVYQRVPTLVMCATMKGATGLFRAVSCSMGTPSHG